MDYQVALLYRVISTSLPREYLVALLSPNRSHLLMWCSIPGRPGSQGQLPEVRTEGQCARPHTLVITAVLWCTGGGAKANIMWPVHDQARKAKTLPQIALACLAVWPFSCRRIILPGRKKTLFGHTPHFRSGPPLWPAFSLFCPVFLNVPVWSVSRVTCRQLPLKLFLHFSSHPACWILVTFRFPAAVGSTICHPIHHIPHTTDHRTRARPVCHLSVPRSSPHSSLPSTRYR